MRVKEGPSSVREAPCVCPRLREAFAREALARERDRPGREGRVRIAAGDHQSTKKSQRRRSHFEGKIVPQIGGIQEEFVQEKASKSQQAFTLNPSKLPLTSRDRFGIISGGGDLVVRSDPSPISCQPNNSLVF